MEQASVAPDVPRAGLSYRFAAWLGMGVMRLQRWRLDIEGLEHVPATGGCVIAANHNSFWDFFAVCYGPYMALGRPVRILAKKSLFDVPVFGALLQRTGCIPVDRGSGQHAFEDAVRAVEAGEIVLVLPEATISPSFDLLPFRTGAVRIAVEAGVPLVPAVSWGTQRFFTTGHRPHWAWQLPVTVRFDSPWHLPPTVDVDAVTERLRRRMSEMLDKVIAMYPDDAPPGAWWVPARLGGGAPPHDIAVAELRNRRRHWRSGRSDPGS